MSDQDRQKPGETSNQRKPKRSKKGAQRPPAETQVASESIEAAIAPEAIVPEEAVESGAAVEAAPAEPVERVASFRERMASVMPPAEIAPAKPAAPADVAQASPCRGGPGHRHPGDRECLSRLHQEVACRGAVVCRKAHGRPLAGQGCGGADRIRATGLRNLRRQLAKDPHALSRAVLAVAAVSEMATRPGTALRRGPKMPTTTKGARVHPAQPSRGRLGAGTAFKLNVAVTDYIGYPSRRFQGVVRNMVSQQGKPDVIVPDLSLSCNAFMASPPPARGLILRQISAALLVTLATLVGLELLLRVASRAISRCAGTVVDDALSPSSALP